MYDFALEAQPAFACKVGIYDGNFAAELHLDFRRCAEIGLKVCKREST